MKRIFSLALAGVMVFSALPMAYAADVDYQNGTEVEYTGSRTTVNADGTETHNAEYTITVPAKLAPGGSGTVTLQGMWPSDATVKVTAEDKVEMVNNINSADKKTLAVTFTAIELAGNNTVAVSDDETVSVADISNALFGTWAGKFNYNVEYNGEAGGAGTETPTPDPDDGENANLFSFTVGGKEYQAEKNMTWYDFFSSDLEGATDFVMTYDQMQTSTQKYILLNGERVSKNSTIVENGQYMIEGVNLITFTIDDATYLAEEDMSWPEWIHSEYNTDGYVVVETHVEDNAGRKLCKEGQTFPFYIGNQPRVEAGTNFTFLSE